MKHVHNNACIFLGPSLDINQARKHLDARYLPPVKYGDVYRVCELFEPAIIGIIDGYFNQVPAVWHKEILWALNQGITVYGAASMGALRAAEMDTFGMKGVGVIYQAYRCGYLADYDDEPFEDDDEVAVVHAPAEMGYKPMSQAMVNLRITLAAACQQDMIPQSSLHELVVFAKQLFYPQRQYEALLDHAEKILPVTQSSALREWLPTGRIDQKQQDAISLLESIQSILPNPGLEHKVPDFVHTSQWDSALAEIDESHCYQHRVLTEFQLLGKPWFDMREQVLDKHERPSVPAYKEQEDQIHRSPDALHAMFSNLWQCRDVETMEEPLSQSVINLGMINILKRDGKFEELERRARDKQQTLMSISSLPEPEDLNEIDLLQLSDWYFETRLGKMMPADIDHYAMNLGLSEADDFYAMILQEYYYLSELEKNERLS